MTNIINRDAIARARDAGREEGEEVARQQREAADPLHFLSREFLIEHCRGDPSNLPMFVAHDDWPANKARVDNRGRIHINRAALLSSAMAAQLPIRKGIMLGPETQEMHIDLTAEQLGGGSDTRHEATQGDYRKLVGADPETGKARTDD